MKTPNSTNGGQSTPTGEHAVQRRLKHKKSASKTLSPLSDSEREQRDGESEPQSFGSYGDFDDTNDMDELPPFGACVGTLQKAAEMALADNSEGDPVFKFARAVKAFELSVDKRLPKDERPAAFNVWWSMAKSTLPPDTDREECLFLFMDAYDKAKHPLGSNVIQIALARVKSNLPPPAALRYESRNLKTLVHLCYELQVLAGDSPFFLSARDAARAIGHSTKNLYHVSAYLIGLQSDGIIKAVQKFKPGVRRATRYRYVAS
jgi:hypothetical protein